MAFGFAVWLAALSVLYGVQATGCAFSLQQIGLGPLSLLRVILLGLFAVAVGVLVWLLLCSRQSLAQSPRRTLDSFLWRASIYLTLGAIAATIWIGMALSLPSICR